MDFCELLKASPDLHHLSPASEEEIRDAEQELGVDFAEEYKEYLRCFGTAIIEDHEFCGICQSPRLNVVDVTLHEREVLANHKCDFMYVVEKLGIDDLSIWQDSKGVVYCSSPQTQVKKIAESLYNYLYNENSHCNM